MGRLSVAVVLAVLLAACQRGAPPSQDARSAARAGDETTPDRPPAGKRRAAARSDYARMRFDFAATEDYNAYGIQLIEKVLIDEAMKAWQAGDAVATTEKLNEVLGVCPVSIEAHRRLADLYEVLLAQFDEQGVGDHPGDGGGPTGAEMRSALVQLERQHREMADGLVKSITDSGDGKSTATAYVVISIPEEYMTMFYLKLKVKGQALIHEGERSYDVLQVEDAGGNEQSVYFDISAFAK